MVDTSSASSKQLCLLEHADARYVYGSKDSFLILNAIPSESDLFERVFKEVTWNEMKHKGGKVPREVAIQGTIFMKNDDEYEPIYRHPADEQPEVLPWTSSVSEIMTNIEELISQKLNHALIQHYRCGKDFIGEHSDKTLDILIGTNIVNYSLGATRVMVLKHKSKTEPTQKIRLPHNSLFVMGWKTNKEWLHSIKEDRRLDFDKKPDELSYNGRRISLTFRTVATFRNRRTNELIGQGAKSGDVEEVSNEEEVKMLRAFSAENKLGIDFDWNKYYGCGYNVLNFKTLNSNVP